MSAQKRRGAARIVMKCILPNDLLHWCYWKSLPSLLVFCKNSPTSRVLLQMSTQMPMVFAGANWCHSNMGICRWCYYLQFPLTFNQFLWVHRSRIYTSSRAIFPKCYFNLLLPTSCILRRYLRSESHILGCSDNTSLRLQPFTAFRLMLLLSFLV
jgi:hypothetical protein